VKPSIVALFILSTLRVLAAQSSPPAVVFHGKCPNELPSYQEWFQQTRLPYSEPYLAPDKRRAQVLEQYSKVKLQMSLEEVEKLFGKPDFSSPRPTARLATAPEPKEQQCSDQVAYIFKKTSENMADMADVAIYFLFSKDGKLYWVIPQNLPSLKPLGSSDGESGVDLAQHQIASWKEYVFADDGFAITFPESPNPHPDAWLPEMTVYSVSVTPFARLSLRVSHEDRDCAETLAQLKDGALKGKSGINPSSVTDVSVDGHPGVEYQYKLDADLSSSDRFYCVNSRFYTFSSNWPGSGPRPAGVLRIISSFRLLDAGPHK
jgi:hypothetical protein